MKKLVLTFDDGPNPAYTEKMLDLLKDEKIKASFFVVARSAVRYPELIKRMKKEGHCVALHSLEHRHALLCGYSYTKYDFSESLKLMKSLNCKIKYFRPPWGARNLFTGKFVKEHNLKMILWDVMAGDWKSGSTPEKIAVKILEKVFDGAVVCLHDGGENYGGAPQAPLHTMDALRMIIPKLREEGYEFVTVEEYMQNE